LIAFLYQRHGASNGICRCDKLTNIDVAPVGGPKISNLLNIPALSVVSGAKSRLFCSAA